MKTKQILTSILIVIMTALISSCTKEDHLIPTEQIVTYSVACDDCLINMQTSKWNESNKFDRSKSQHFNVTGSFSHSFNNAPAIDTAIATVSVSVLYPTEQAIRLSIFDNQGRKVEVIDTIGFSSDYSKDESYEFTAKLALK